MKGAIGAPIGGNIRCRLTVRQHNRTAQQKFRRAVVAENPFNDLGGELSYSPSLGQDLA